MLLVGRGFWSRSAWADLCTHTSVEGIWKVVDHTYSKTCRLFLSSGYILPPMMSPSRTSDSFSCRLVAQYTIDWLATKPP